MKGNLELVLALLMVCCMVFSLSACGEQSTVQKPANEPAGNSGNSGNEDSEQVNLTMSTFLYVETPHRKAIDGLIEEYNKTHPGFNVEISGAGYENYWDNLTAEILAGNETDIIQIYPENLSQYNSLRTEGVFYDLTDLMKEAGLEGKLIGQETGMLDGRALAISNYSWGTTGIFYRKSMLEKAGINPDEIKTQEDFRNACLKFVDGDNKAMGVVYGTHGFVVSEWCRLIARPVSNGLYFKDGETGPYTAERVNINSPENIWAAQWWQDFIAKDKAVKLVPDKKDSRELFWNGNVPFNYDGPWFIGMTRERDAALLEDTGLIPQFDMVYEGKTYKPNPSNYPVLTCIGTSCKNPEAAWDFIKWMTTTEAQKIVQDCGQIPSNAEYASSEEYKNGHELEYSFVDYINNNYTTLVSDPAIPQYGEISKVMIETAQVIFSDKVVDVKPELDAAQAKIEEIMNK